MAYTEEQKATARELDPECWESYSGKSKEYKQRMDLRRTVSLREAVAACQDEEVNSDD